MKRNLLLLTAALPLMLLTACAKEVSVTVQNRSGKEITKVRISWAEDISKFGALENALPDNGEAVISVGKFKEDALEAGFAVTASAADTYITYDSLALKDGDTLIFYTDAYGTKIAVNKSALEIEAMIKASEEQIHYDQLPDPDDF